jgi:hypothetical protein
VHPDSMNELYAARDDMAVRLASFQHESVPN